MKTLKLYKEFQSFHWDKGQYIIWILGIVMFPIVLLILVSVQNDIKPD